MRVRRHTLVSWAALLASVAAATPAHAGRTPFGWLLGTEVMPERGAELETWIAEENGKSTPGGAEVHDATWLASALVGATDQLELSLPVELLWREVAPGPAAFSFRRYGLEARYRWVSPDPVDAPALVPVTRVAVKRDLIARDVVRVEANAIASYRAGPVIVGVDLGFVGDLAREDSHTEVRPALGVSVEVARDLRVGGEVYAELSLDDRKQSWVIVGPNAAWSHGRFWISAAFGVGVYEIDTAPRVQWGIMF